MCAHAAPPLRLGAWVGNQRSRAATLTPERVEQLSKIGMRCRQREPEKLLDDAQRGAVYLPSVPLRVRQAGGGQQLLHAGGRRGGAVDPLVAPRGVQVAAAQQAAVVEALEPGRDRLAVLLLVLQEADVRAAARFRCQRAELALPTAVRDRVRPVPGSAEAQTDTVEGIAVRVVYELQKGLSGVLPDRHGDVLRVVQHGHGEAVGKLFRGQPAGEHHVVAPEGDGLRGSKPGCSVCHDRHPGRCLRQLGRRDL
ncbi:helicase associated domain-containing protein [Streptomyces sp. NPDC056638]|uniref:helicase associated domain-containing protein n=1 Tax=Streptomyces sp. NPDC056638 TaxID=3345887 RepID=UPI0036CED981